MRASTHNVLNSTAHIFCSLTFGALDVLYLTDTIPRGTNSSYGAVAARLTGTVAWNFAAWIMLFHSLAHDRRQENHPEEDVRACDVDPSIYDLIVQVLFLIAAFCYLGQRFSDIEINPFGASNIFLWLLANTIGLFDAAYDVHHRNDDLQPEVEIHLPPEPPRVEVIEEDDAIEESSSDVVIESPGGFRLH